MNLVPHFSSAQLKEKYRKSKDPVEARRWHLLWKISLGWQIKDSAVAVGMNYDYARKIVKRYNELGEEGVKNQRKKPQTHKRGKKALLSDEQIAKLTNKITGKAPDGGNWTGPKVARWIEEETGVEKVWNQRGWDYLKKCRKS
ncbi:MAG: helix-turn-helix domain-containing protein [Okeania sp. SIO2D1]|nr:helix-turn-helix domain-containing protein [Okeania sp. SIO2D1]